MSTFLSALFWYGPFFGSLYYTLLLDDFENVSRYAILTVLNVTLTASIIICVILLLRFLLGRAPRFWSYALWGIVLIRLLLPVAVSSDFSLLNTLDVPASQRSMVEYVKLDTLEVELPIETVSDAINERTVNPTTGQVYQDAYEFEMSVGCIIWTLGVRVMGVYAIVSYILLRRRLVGAMQLRANIFIADNIGSPFVTGLFRPRIYLPSSLSETEREYIILHEQHHIRRGDHIIKLLAFTALALHLFNPLVWLAFVLSGRDMEMSCDEAVVKKLDADTRASYSESLLRLATGRRIIAATPLAFGEGKVARRIKNILSYRRPALWVSIIAALAIALAALTLLTNPGKTGDVSRSLRPGVYTGGEQAYYFYAADNGSLPGKYCVSKDGYLYTYMHSSDSWQLWGELEKHPMSYSELSGYIHEDGWTNNYSLTDIKFFTECWQIKVKDSSFALLLQTAEGKTFLAIGTEDLSERGEVGSDDTSIQAIWEIEFTYEMANPALPASIANPVSRNMNAFMVSQAYYPPGAGTDTITRLADNLRLYYGYYETRDLTEAHLRPLLTIPIANMEDLNFVQLLLDSEMDISLRSDSLLSIGSGFSRASEWLDGQCILVCYAPFGGTYSANETYAEDGTLVVELTRSGTEEETGGCLLFIRVPEDEFNACHSYNVCLWMDAVIS